MNILHIINSLNLGGAERLLIDFVKHYKTCFPEDHHFLLTLQDGNVKFVQEIKPFIISHFSFKLKSSNQFFLKTRALKQIVRKNKIDIIHGHLTYSIVLSRMIRLKNVARFATYHNMEYSKESPNYSKIMPKLDKFFFRPNNSFSIYVSNEVKKAVKSQVSIMNQGKVIPNFAAERFSYQYIPKKNRVLKLIAVGGLKKVKNHKFLLKALRAYSKSKIKLDIYGEGSYRGELQKTIDRDNLPVCLKGSQYITSDLLCRYDAFVLPSFSEGMPISLIEAMSSGMPSILSDLPQLRDVAQDSGLYFNPFREQEFKEILDDLLANRFKLEIMSNKAKNLSGGFSVNHYVRELNNLYKQQFLKNKMN